MNAARRARKRQREIEAGKHTGADHLPGQSCVACRPGALAPEDRSKVRLMDAAAAKEISHQTLLDGQRVRSGMSIGRRVGMLARQRLEAQQGLAAPKQRTGSRRGD
jgi:hypothetical protein